MRHSSTLAKSTSMRIEGRRNDGHAQSSGCGSGIHLRTKDVPSYFVEWFSLIQLEQAGIAAETLKPGDRVVVTGNPMRDESKKSSRC
jgi:hypothetical protein